MSSSSASNHMTAGEASHSVLGAGQPGWCPWSKTCGLAFLVKLPFLAGLLHGQAVLLLQSCYNGLSKGITQTTGSHGYDAPGVS